MSGQQWGYTADNGKLNYILLRFKKQILGKMRQTNIESENSRLVK